MEKTIFLENEEDVEKYLTNPGKASKKLVEILSNY